MTHSDVYSLPIPMRHFYIQKLVSFKEKENASPSQQPLVAKPDIPTNPS